MTVNTAISSVNYNGDGTSPSFSIPFYFLANSHIKASIVELATGIVTPWVLNTNYSVTGAGIETGGTLTPIAGPLSALYRITIYRLVPIDQQVDYVPNDKFPAEVTETAFDKLTMIAQQLNQAGLLSLSLPITATSGVSTVLPNPQANFLIGWNSGANGITNIDPATLASIITFGTFNYFLGNGDGVTTDFTLSSDALIAANIDLAVGGVVQRTPLDYTYLGNNVVRISPAPPIGTNNIFMRWGSALPMGVATSVSGQTTFGTSVIQAVSAAAAGLVDTTNAQTIAGIKTYSASPLVPTLAITDLSQKNANSTYINALLATAIKNVASGLGLSTAGASATLTIAAGSIADSTSSVIILLAAAMAKTTAIWAAGTASGGLDTGAIANNTTYHWYLIRNPTTGAVDVKFSLSASAPALTAGFTQFRYLAPMRTNGSAQWVGFIQDGDYFRLSTSILDVNATTPGTAALSLTLGSIPTGVNVFAEFNFTAFDTAGVQGVYFSDLAISDQAPSVAGAAPLISSPLTVSTSNSAGYGFASIRTNTAAQIRARFLAGGGGVTYQIATLGWKFKMGSR